VLQSRRHGPLIGTQLSFACSEEILMSAPGPQGRSLARSGDYSFKKPELGLKNLQLLTGDFGHLVAFVNGDTNA
jgi:hypothetical protein